MKSYRKNPYERAVMETPSRTVNTFDRQSSTTSNKDQPRDTFRRNALPHLDALHRHASKLCRSNDDVKDLVEETFLAVSNDYEADDDEDELKIRLFSTLKDIYIEDYEESGESMENVQLDPLFYEEKLDDVPLGVDDDHRETFLENISSEEIAQAMNDLPEEYFFAVDLATVEDFSYDEVAEILDRPRERVKSQIRQGLDTIKEDLVENAIAKELFPSG